MRPRSLSRLVTLAAVLVGLSVVARSAMVATAVDGVWPECPADLRLTPEEDLRCQALSAFAMGLMIQLEGENPEKGKHPRFVRYYEKALDSTPDSQTVLEFLVAPWLVERNYDAIVKNVGPIAARHPEATRLLLVVAEALSAQEKVTEATELLEAALRRLGYGDPELFRELCSGYWRAKRYRELEDLLRRVPYTPGLRESFVAAQTSAVFYDGFAKLDKAALGGRNPKVFLRLARAQTKRAVALAVQAERVEDVETLASLLMSQGNWDEVVDLVQSLRTADQDASPELDLLLVQGLFHQGRKEDALGLVGDVGQRADLPPNLYAEIGRLLLMMDAPDRAAAYYERALLAYPQALELRLRLGYLYLRLGQPERVSPLLEKYAKLPPEGHLLVSHALRRLERTADAAKELARAEEVALKMENKDFFSVEFYLFYATLCEDLGYTDRGLEKVRKALELEPDDPVCANFLGYVLADHNRGLPEAERRVRLALKAEPDNFAYLDSIAWVYYRQKRFPEAMVEINRALRLAGREVDPVIFDHAGDIYAANGLWLLARKYWQDALSSGSHEAEKIRRKLRESPVAGPARVPGVGDGLLPPAAAGPKR